MDIDKYIESISDVSYENAAKGCRMLLLQDAVLRAHGDSTLNVGVVRNIAKSKEYYLKQNQDRLHGSIMRTLKEYNEKIAYGEREEVEDDEG